MTNKQNKPKLYVELDCGHGVAVTFPIEEAETYGHLADGKDETTKIIYKPVGGSVKNLACVAYAAVQHAEATSKGAK